MCIMSKLHVNHIKSFLENTFSEFIDIADLSKKSKEEQHKNCICFLELLLHMQFPF